MSYTTETAVELAKQGHYAPILCDEGMTVLSTWQDAHRIKFKGYEGFAVGQPKSLSLDPGFIEREGL
jgi:hypothetical protein